MSVLSANPMRAQAGHAATQGLAIDGRSLDGLRTAAPGDRAAIRQVAEQFEALFMQQLLKSMRDAVPQSGLFDGQGSEVYRGMLDSQLSSAATGRPGGLADVIERQLLGGAAAPGGTAADKAGGPAAGALAGGQLRAGRRLSAGAPFMPQPLAQQGSGLRPSVRQLLSSGAKADEMAADDALLERLGPVQRAFVGQMWPHARAAEGRTGVPAAWVVAQAALESGWGRRDIRDADGSPSHNLFGIKAGGAWRGATVAALTTEYVDGKPRKSVEQFRRYGSYAEAFEDWAALMAANPRYRQVLQAGNAAQFADGLEQGGYATDPAYAKKLLRTIGVLSAAAGTRS